MRYSVEVASPLVIPVHFPTVDGGVLTLMPEDGVSRGQGDGWDVEAAELDLEDDEDEPGVGVWGVGLKRDGRSNGVVAVSALFQVDLGGAGLWEGRSTFSVGAAIGELLDGGSYAYRGGDSYWAGLVPAACICSEEPIRDLCGVPFVMAKEFCGVRRVDGKEVDMQVSDQGEMFWSYVLVQPDDDTVLLTGSRGQIVEACVGLRIRFDKLKIDGESVSDGLCARFSAARLIGMNTLAWSEQEHSWKESKFPVPVVFSRRRVYGE